MISQTHKKNFHLTLLLIAVSHYILEGILFNPLIIWTLLPLYIALTLFNTAYKAQDRSALPKVYGFMAVSLTLSYLYHFAWFFDWQGTATSSSTSALIFIFFPIYAVVAGGIGWLVGVAYVKAKALMANR